MLLEAPRAVRLIPFSACKLPVGTTKLELVTSGRSVWISLWLSGQYSAAEASATSRSSPTNRSASTNVNPTEFAVASLRHSAGRKTSHLRRDRQLRRRLSAGRALLGRVAARSSGRDAGRRPQPAGGRGQMR